MYSTDGHLLTGYSHFKHCSIVSWDLQTGGLISNIRTKEILECNSVSHSGCGTMLGGLFGNSSIITYNILSGTQISSHVLQRFISIIWTCGESLQFATMEPGSITIWEVSFTSSHAPTQISSFPIPDNFSKKLVFFPALFQLVLILKDRVSVWDVQNQKILLNSTDVICINGVSFSSNGDFFICYNQGSHFYLWKKSPDGYLLHQEFASEWSKAIISPNGELIVSFYGNAIQLWHTNNSPTISTQSSQHTGGFYLEFSPDESLVVVAQKLGNIVTVLDLESGSPQLVIDAGINICGIGITGSKIIVVGDGKIITWELPARDHLLNAQGCINNSAQITTFEPSGYTHASVSPDLNYVAVWNHSRDLSIYNMYTGEKIAAAISSKPLLGFTPSGDKVWCAKTDSQPSSGRWIVSVSSYAFVRHNMSNTMKLKLDMELCDPPPSDFPWDSSCGHQVTDEEWIISPSGKKLLWLPHQWQSNQLYRKWGGRFLALLDSGLPEAIIIDLGLHQ